MTLPLPIHHGEKDLVETGKMAERLAGVHPNERGKKQAQALSQALKDVSIKLAVSHFLVCQRQGNDS